MVFPWEKKHMAWRAHRRVDPWEQLHQGPGTIIKVHVHLDQLLRHALRIEVFSPLRPRPPTVDGSDIW